MNVYKGRGNVLACASYRGIKLMKQAMLVLGRLIEGLPRFKVEIQFGFMARRSRPEVFLVEEEAWRRQRELESVWDKFPKLLVVSSI